MVLWKRRVEVRNRKRRQRRSSGILSFATLSRYVINLLYHNPKASSWEFQELCPNVLILSLLLTLPELLPVMHDASDSLFSSLILLLRWGNCLQLATAEAIDPRSISCLWLFHLCWMTGGEAITGCWSIGLRAPLPSEVS